MNRLSKSESEQAIVAFLKTLRSDVQDDALPAEFFELKIEEPHYELLYCAFLQTADKQAGLLFEALTNRYFLLKVDNGGMPVLQTLSKAVGALIPGKIKEKLLWVCGNRSDKVLEPGDFEAAFTLTKGKK